MCILYNFLNWTGRFLPHMLLRLVVAWQAWDAGLLKYHASEKVLAVQETPLFNWMWNDVSFPLVMWWQLVGAIFILIGFRTRIVVLGLIVLSLATLMTMLPIETETLATFWRDTAQETMAVKFELLFLLILLALFFLGSGGFSVDAVTGWFGCGKYARRARKERKEKAKLKVQEKKLAKQQAKLEKKAGQAQAKAQEQAANAEGRKRRIKVKEDIDRTPSGE